MHFNFINKYIQVVGLIGILDYFLTVITFHSPED